MEPVYYGIAVEPEEAARLAMVMTRQTGCWFVSSLTETDRERVSALVKAEGVLHALDSAKELCEPLVRSVVPMWPTEPAGYIEVMANEPHNLQSWGLRNLLYQAATGGFMWFIGEATSRTLDITTHLTVARMLGHTSIGILPSNLRTLLETTQLTMTDHIVGEADPRALSVVLASLTRDPGTTSE